MKETNALAAADCHAGRRSGGFRLDGQMHALVAAVLLGMAGPPIRSRAMPSLSHHAE